jgi:hypothetical protein
MLELLPVATPNDWSEFLELPFRVYRGDPCWVPPWHQEVRDRLDVARHPFYEHARLRPLLARRGGVTVGRVVGIVDDDYNRYHDDRAAFFGFYEGVDDFEVARSLLEGLTEWAQSQGLRRLIGPMNPSTNYECGLLVEGYDTPPTVLMSYNPRYYPAHFERCGLVKLMDTFAYCGPVVPNPASPALVRHAERLRLDPAVRVRPLDLARLDRELDVLREVYNDAWADNWGFVPLGPREFAHILHELRPLLTPQLCPVVEVSGRPAAMLIVLPDVNQVGAKIGGGHLSPLKRLKMWWHLRGPGRRRIDRARLLALGVKRRYQPLGLGAVLYQHALAGLERLGFREWEASWILESNIPMNKVLRERFGRTRAKVYRIYEKCPGAGADPRDLPRPPA